VGLNNEAQPRLNIGRVWSKYSYHILLFKVHAIRSMLPMSGSPQHITINSPQLLVIILVSIMAHLASPVAAFILIIASASLAIGLTYLPCYATICSEDHFPFETRLHIATYYGLLMAGSCLLLLQVSTQFGQSLSRSHLSPVLPVLGKRITVGGLTISLLVISTTLATTSFWLPAQLEFWGARTDPLEWDTAKIRLTVTGITGHYADILLGLLLIPVSRNSLVGQSFGVHQSTLLSAHKLIAYLFLAATLAHGMAYGVSQANSTPYSFQADK
jgi:hypothetical protein